jgi:hypothetical protein
MAAADTAVAGVVTQAAAVVAVPVAASRAAVALLAARLAGDFAAAP